MSVGRSAVELRGEEQQHLADRLLLFLLRREDPRRLRNAHHGLYTGEFRVTVKFRFASLFGEEGKEKRSRSRGGARKILSRCLGKSAPRRLHVQASVLEHRDF